MSGYAEKRGLKCDLLPTPTAQDTPHPTDRVDENGRRWTENASESHSMGLSDIAHHQMLPTPRANKVTDCDLNNPKLANRNHANLEEEIAKMIVAEGMLHTPTAHDCKMQTMNEACAARVGKHEKTIPETISQMVTSYPKTDGEPFQLSPLFVADMMGFPVTWLDI